MILMKEERETVKAQLGVKSQGERNKRKIDSPKDIFCLFLNLSRTSQGLPCPREGDRE